MTKRNDRHLTMAELRRPDRRGRDRHRRRRVHRHAGPPAGQAAARPLLRRRRRRARHRGLQLPARGRRRHEHRRRLRDLVVGARLRRHGVRPRRADHPGAHAPAGDRDGAVRPGLARPLPRGAVAAQRSCSAQLDKAAAQGWQALAGTELEFIAFDTTYEAAADAALPRPDAGQPVQRRLLDPRHHPRRAAAARDPQHDVRRRAGRRGRQGRVQLRPARGRVPLRRRADHRRQPRGLQDRRQGDRRPAGQGDHVHGEVQPARGQLLPHPPVAARRRTASLVFWDKDAGTSTPLYDSFVAGVLATVADFTLLYAPNINSYKRFAGGLVRADRDRLGPRQPHLRGPAGRQGCRRADGEPDPRRRRQPVPRHGGDAGRRAARHRAGARARAGAGRQRLRLRQAARPVHDGRRPGSASPPPRSPGRASATRSSTTTSTWPTSSWRPTAPRSPTGSCAGGSSGCDAPSPSINPATEQAGRRRRRSPTWPRPTPRSRPRTRRSRRGRRSRPASGRRCCAGSPPSWTRTSRSWPSSRSATPATPGATPAGRPATSGTA